MINVENVEKAVEICRSCLKADDKEDRTHTYSDIITFDIETTNLQKYKLSFMYIWQMCINGVCIYGRYWETFKAIIEHLKTYRKRFIVWVHNLGFEFEYIRTFWHWDKQFSRDSHKPLFIQTNNVEFRCSYMMSGYSLAKLAENYNLEVQKLKGDLDYNLIRTPNTPLTQKELAYCENDVLILYYYIKYMLEQYKKYGNLKRTQTGYVRKYVSEHLQESDNWYKQRGILKRNFTYSLELYKLLREAFTGGFTHANALYTGLTIENVSSIDFTSSYPTRLVCNKFPTKFIEYKPQNFKYLLQQDRALLMRVRYTNIKATTSHSIISQHKCVNIKNGTFDNGRVHIADELIITITEQDYHIIKEYYTYDKFEISKLYASKKEYLNKGIVESVLQLYADKTQLKGIEGKEVEYLRAKQLLNGLYGMHVLDILQPNSFYNETSGEWCVESKEEEKALQEYIENRDSFLLYAVGVWVTAYSRYELLHFMRQFADDVIYCDTDSIKMLNYDKHKKLIEKYNKEITEKIEKAVTTLKIDKKLLYCTDINGEYHPLGVWDYEGTSRYFKTLGCKRYLEYKKGKIRATVAGAPKQSIVNYVTSDKDFKTPTVDDCFKKFNNGLYLSPKISNKKMHTYHDKNESLEIEDYNGNKQVVEIGTGCYISPTDFSMSITKQYVQFLTTVIRCDNVHMDRFN